MKKSRSAKEQTGKAESPFGLSYFYDNVWRLAPPAPGQKGHWGAIKWSIRLDDGSFLTDPQHARLLWHLKMLLATAIKDPRGSKSISEGGLSSFTQTIATGASWMVSEHLDDFSRLDNAASWRYFDWFKENYEGSGSTDHRHRKLTWASANLRLRFPALVYRQQPALRIHAIAVVEEQPFDGRSVDAVVTEDLKMRRGDKETPIPDAVFLSIVHGALRLLDQAAEDVIELQALCCPQLHGPHPGSQAAHELEYAEVGRILDEYIPSTLPSEKIPWIDLRRPYTRLMDDGRIVTVGKRQILRRAFIAIQSACVVAIQALAAMRVDQLASIEDDSFAGLLPSCITAVRSADGLMENFYVSSINLKQRDPALTLIGSRPWGTEHLPPVVRALSVLHRLTMPWRVMAGTKRLMIVFKSARGLPRTGEQISHATACGVTIAEREFFRDWCDLDDLDDDLAADYVFGKGIRDQKWRTTFAQYKMRIDDRLMPEIAQHFKHLRMSTTEHRYVGADARFMGSEIDPAYYEAAQLLYEILEDGEPMVGRFADFVRSFGARYRGSVADYELAVTTLDFRFFVFEYGVCGVAAMPERSQCNKNAGTESWLRVAPNEAFRAPLTCLGCPCFAAMTKHLGYWERRVTAIEVYLARSDDLEANAREVMKLRLKTAKAMRDGLRHASRRTDESFH